MSIREEEGRWLLFIVVCLWLALGIGLACLAPELADAVALRLRQAAM